MNNEDKIAIDRLAEKAMQGLMSSDFWSRYTFTHPDMVNEVVRISYMVAYAMLAASKEVKQ